MFKQFSKMKSTSREDSLSKDSELVKEKSVSSLSTTPKSPRPKSKTYGEINPFDPKVNVIVLNGDVMPTVSAVRVPGLHPRRKIASLPGRFVTLPIPDKLAGDGLTDTEFSDGMVIEEVVEDDPLPQRIPDKMPSSTSFYSDAKSPRSQPATSPRASEATSPRAQVVSRVVSMSRAQSKTAGLDVNNNASSKDSSPRAIDISTARGSSAVTPRFWTFTKSNSATSQLSEDKSLGSPSGSISPRPASSAGLAINTRMVSMSRGPSKTVGFALSDDAADTAAATGSAPSPRMWAFAKTNSTASHISVISTDDKNDNKSDTKSDAGEEKPQQSSFVPDFPTASSPREQHKAKLASLTLDHPDDIDGSVVASIIQSKQEQGDQSEEMIVERPLTDFEASIQTLTDYLERPFVAMFHLYTWANLDDKERRTTKDRPTVTYEETVTLLRAMVDWKEFGNKARFFTLNADEQTVAKELYMKLLTLLMVHGAIATGCDMSEVQRWHGDHLGYRIGGIIWSMSDLHKVVDYSEEQDEVEVAPEQQQRVVSSIAAGGIKLVGVLVEDGDASVTAESK